MLHTMDTPPPVRRRSATRRRSDAPARVEVTPPIRPSWVTLALLVAVCLVGAGVAGFAGLLYAGGFATAPPEPVVGWVAWSIAGAALACPVWALPALAFPVRRRASLVAGLAVAIVVAVGGMAYSTA